MMKLESVPEFYLNRKAAEYARSLLRDDIFLELHQGSDPEKGRIFDVVNNEFINDVLFCYGQEEQEEETFQELEPEDKEFTHVQEEIFKFENIRKKELPLEDEVTLMIYDTSQLEENYIISCINIDDLG
uniref:Uncharacterized protein n=1 Tax=Megaselia scalaris TaxID=36166 RepID=T1H2S7_MEGSC